MTPDYPKRLYPLGDEEWQAVLQDHGIPEDEQGATDIKDDNIHPQVRVRLDDYPPDMADALGLGEKYVDVDEEIAELITEMWRAGIVTTMSCQDTADQQPCDPDLTISAGSVNGGHRIHIEFDDPEDLASFIVIAAGPPSPDPESIRNRAGVDLDGDEPDDWENFRRYRMWKYSASPGPLIQTPDGPALSTFFMAVSFPVSDYPTVLERVQSWNTSRSEPG